jgi:hypothetical protein
VILPGFVTILGRRLEVKLVDEPKDGKGTEACGVYDQVGRAIEIKAGMPPIYQFMVLWHEALHHAMTFQVNGLTDEEEEALVNGFGIIVADILETNECMRTPWGPE